MGNTISRLIGPDLVQMPLVGVTLEGIVGDLTGRLSRNRMVSDPDLAIRSVLARENHISTMLGDGIAMPHARTPAAASLCAAIGIAPDGLDLATHDGLPIHIVVMMLAPESHQGPYIRFLAEISTLLHRAETRQALIAAATPEEVVAILGGRQGGLPGAIGGLFARRSASTAAA